LRKNTTCKKQSKQWEKFEMMGGRVRRENPPVLSLELLRFLFSIQKQLYSNENNGFCFVKWEDDEDE
jgi:hypothetical protein